MPRKRTPVQIAGVAGVAEWLDVSPQLVTKWLIRYRETHPTPAPDFEIRPGRNGEADRAWKDTAERRAEWVAWRKSLPGQGAPGQPKPRRATAEAAK